MSFIINLVKDILYKSSTPLDIKFTHYKFYIFEQPCFRSVLGVCSSYSKNAHTLLELHFESLKSCLDANQATFYVIS